MTELYIPKPGERVRVVEVWEGDAYPRHRVGQDVTVSLDETETFVATSASGWIILNSGTYCRVEPVEKSEPTTCSDCGAVEHPLNEGRLCDRCYERPTEPQPERRFCACGQELFGWKSAVWCGDCHAHLENPQLTGDDIDLRIRDAQPETEEHAFDRPGYSWP